RVANLNELFVHHEDVRRANDAGARTLAHGEASALFENAVRARRFLARRLRGAGLELEWTGTGAVVPVRRSEPIARVRGLPGELLRLLFGRTEAAAVEITGPADAVARVRRARFGM